MSKLYDVGLRVPTCEGIDDLQPLSLLSWDVLVPKCVAPIDKFRFEGLDLHLLPDEVEVTIDIFFLNHHIVGTMSLHGNLG